MYAYPDQGLCDDEPVDPIVELEVQPDVRGDPYRECRVCHNCFFRLSPDMWIGENCWRKLNPVVPFSDLPLHVPRAPS